MDIIESKRQSRGLPTRKAKDIFQMIKDRSDTIARILPDSNDSSSFVQACLSAIMDNPKLQACSQSSIMKAIMESARYGLEPNSPLSHAALIPFGGKVQFLIEYRGLLKLAWNSGIVQSIDYDKICANDIYTYTKGFDAKFQHTPNLDSDRGDAIAYYAMALTVGGGKALVVMTKKEIAEHGRRFSRSFSSPESPWMTDFDAMAFKTVIRQLLDKKLPKSATPAGRLLQEAAHRDDIPEEKKKWSFPEDGMEIKPDPEPEPEPEPEPDVAIKENEAHPMETKEEPEPAQKKENSLGTYLSESLEVQTEAELRSETSVKNYNEIALILQRILQLNGDPTDMLFDTVSRKTITEPTWKNLSLSAKKKIYSDLCDYLAKLEQ